jgi:hypothetical protein
LRGKKKIFFCKIQIMLFRYLKPAFKLGVVYMPVISAPERLMQEDHKFEASLGHTAKSCLRKPKAENKFLKPAFTKEGEFIPRGTRPIGVWRPGSRLLVMLRAPWMLMALPQTSPPCPPHPPHPPSPAEGGAILTAVLLSVC